MMTLICNVLVTPKRFFPWYDMSEIYKIGGGACARKKETTEAKCNENGQRLYSPKRGAQKSSK